MNLTVEKLVLLIAFLLVGAALVIWGGDTGAQVGGSIIGGLSVVLLAIFGVNTILNKKPPAGGT